MPQVSSRPSVPLASPVSSSALPLHFHSENPSLTPLDDLVAEAVARLEAGEPLDAAALTADCPELREPLEKLLPTLAAMVDLGHAAAAADVPQKKNGARNQLGFSPPPCGEGPGEGVGPSNQHPASSTTGILGDFRIIREIGRGGMGVVYEAEQISLGRRVALKVLPFAAMLDSQQLTRFKNEARAAATLKHPNIVSVYSVGSERGVHFYAMELIEGSSLAEVIAAMKGGSREQGAGSREEDQQSSRAEEQSSSGVGEERSRGNDPTAIYSATPLLHSSPDTAAVAQLSTLRSCNHYEYFQTAARLGIQAAEALQHAHDLGVLHRDIKPANLLLGADSQLYVTDFGLARIEADAGVTMTGDIVGTFRYMAPEQALAKRVVIDHRADVYSLGATLYELLTLEPAFGESDRSALLKQIAFEEPKPLRKLDRHIPAELETIVLKALEKNPDERYQTSGRLADDLRAFLESRPIKAKPPTLVGLARKWSRRHKPLVSSVAVSAAALLIITLGVLASSNMAIKREQDKTENALEDRTIALASSERNYKRALEAVDQLLARVGNEKLAEVPQLDQLRMDVLNDTLKFYESFIAENPGDRKLQFELAKTYRRVGMMYHDFWRNTAAQWHRNKAIAILEDLHAADSANSEYRYELAVALFQYGWMANTPSCFPRSIDLFEGLIHEFPDNASYREGLADALRSYGDDITYFFPKIGQSVDTVKVRSIVKRAFEAARSPGVYKRYVGHAHDLSAALAICEKRLDDAEADFWHAIEAYSMAIAERPTDGRTREHQLKSYSRLAALLQQRGDAKQAENWYRKAIELAEELTHDFPSMRNFRTARNDVVERLVRVLQKQDRIEDATKLLAELTPTGPRDFVHRAELYIRLGQRTPAEADFQQAIDRSQQDLQTDPANPDPYDSLFSGLMGLDRTKEALTLARNMPMPDVEWLAARAQLYREFDSGSTPEDKQALIDLQSQLAGYFPGNVLEISSLAVAFRKAGQLDKALLEAEKAVKADPNFMHCRFSRGWVYLELGQLEEAIADFNDAIRLMPEQSHLHFSRAFALSRLERHDEALVDLEEALSIDPNQAEAWNIRGLVHYDLQQFDKAVEDHNEAIRLSQNLASYFANRAKAYVSLKRFNEALSDCQQAIDLDSKARLAWNVRGFVHYSMKQYDKAIEDWSEAIRLEPQGVMNWINRGNAHLRLKEYEKAVEDCSEAIRLAPDYSNAWHTRGIAYSRMKQYDKSIENFNEAIRLDPKDPISISSRGNAYRDWGRYHEAIVDYEAALALDEKNWSPRINLAWLLATAHVDEFRDGPRALKLAQSTYDAGDFGTYGEANFLRTLAAAHAEVGNFDKAIECCQKAILLVSDEDKEDGWAKELPAQLESYQSGSPWRIGAQ